MLFTLLQYTSALLKGILTLICIQQLCFSVRMIIRCFYSDQLFTGAYGMQFKANLKWIAKKYHAGI